MKLNIFCRCSFFSFLVSTLYYLVLPIKRNRSFTIFISSAIHLRLRDVSTEDVSHFVILTVLTMPEKITLMD